MSRALMVLGTASHVGKSVLTAAFCRILVNRGLRVAPFKAQNMALNSAATPDGLEIGRAQAMQAEACRIPATVDMNPILIKPSTDVGAQVVVHGKIWRTVTAAEFFKHKVRELFPLVRDSYQRLAAAHDVVVLEGAGSPAEINLKDGDLVNMRMAAAAGAACVLVGDIDRGGVFASIVGTLALLEPSERALIRGFLINRFRGDRTLLMPGIKTIEDRIGLPCVGVVPYVRDLGLDEEDSVSLEHRPTPARAWAPRRDRTERPEPSYRSDDDERSPERPLRIGVIGLPHMSNFTDFDPLSREPSVSLAYVVSPEDVSRADVLVLPGTKQTLDDLAWLDERGLTPAIAARAAHGGVTLGICGGMQMLGARISDPESIEGGGGRDGLGLLPIDTTLARHKVTVQSRGTLCDEQLFGVPISVRDITGYEIHVGVTHMHDGARGFARLTRGAGASDIVDGAQSVDGHIVGTYLHGLFDDDAWRHTFIAAARAVCGLAPAGDLAFVARERDGRFERFASIVEQSCDVDTMIGWLT
jgi:adenosylcobyric acid synthase